MEFRKQVAAAVAMLAGYWAVFAIFPGRMARGQRPAISAR